MVIARKIKRTTKKILVRLGYYTKPSFMIIGAQKAGTTALFQILNQHPMILGSKIKEPHFFNKKTLDLKRDILHYHALFPLPHRLPPGALTFEATPNYLVHITTPERLYTYNPELKLIAILRNPTERALSAWTMFHHQREPETTTGSYEPRPFREAILEEINHIQNKGVKRAGPNYIMPGIYIRHLKRYLEFFPENQLLILEHSRLKTHFDDTIGQILDFVGLPRMTLQNADHHTRQVNNQNDYREEMDILNEFFRPHNEALFELLGKRYDWND